jgi:hypothetical protein
MRMTEQIVVLYPDADVAHAGYATFPKAWDAAFGPLPSHVLVRRADDADGRRWSFILRTRGADIPWDITTGPPPRVALCESVFAEIADTGEHRSLIATVVKATVSMRIKRRLSSWSSTGWVLPTVDLIGGDEKPAH